MEDSIKHHRLNTKIDRRYSYSFAVTAIVFLYLFILIHHYLVTTLLDSLVFRMSIPILLGWEKNPKLLGLRFTDRKNVL